METGGKKERNISEKKSAEILVVEDSITQATQLKHLLGSQDYKVTVAKDGKEAIDRLSKHKPSLVISDIMMPEMNGYELCKKIKSNKNTEDIPVILLTVLADPEEIIEGLSCGADSFITKPYNEKHLLSNVEKLFSEGNKEDKIKVPFGIQILFKGKKRLIQAEQQNVIKLILDIYEGAIHQNEKLIQTQEELGLLNDRLESMVADRTADLSEEIKLSNKITGKLKESEKKYRRIFENVQDLYYETSIEGTIINISPSIETLSKGKYQRDDLIGKSMYDFYSDIDERTTLISQLREKGAVSDYEITLKNKDGSRVPCSVSSKICFDAQGRPEKIIGSVRDITERKKAEETIRVLARFPSENPDPVLRVDVNGRLLYANEVSFNLLTWKLEIGKEIPSFLKKIISEVLKEGIGRTIETEHYNKNFSLSIVPILEEGYVNLYFRNITDLKKAEDVLRERESSLRDAQEIGKMGSWEWDMVTQITNWSDNYFAIHGIKPAEVEPSFELFRSKIHPDDVHILDEIHASVIKDKAPFSFELRLIQPDGTIKWIQNNISPVIEHDKVIKLKGVIIDITERRRAEDKLRSSEERLKILFDYAPDAYYLNDLKGNFIDGNFAAEKLLGYKREELIGKNFLKLKLLSLNQLPAAAKLLVKNTIGQVTGPNEFVLTRKDRSKVSVEIITHPVKIKDQTLVLGIARDITERKQAENALRESEEKFRSIMENSADAIFITDQQGKYLYTNKAVTVMLGFTPEEMQRKTIIDLAPPDKTDEYFEVFKKVMSKGKVFTELELLKKDGHFISTDLNSVLLPGGLIYGSCRDITERKNAEEALRQSFAFSESLLKTIPFGMDIVNETGTILFQSENFRRMFGEEAMGKKCWEMYRDDKKQCSDCPLTHGITVGDTEVYESHGVLGNRIFEINHTGMIYQGKKAMLEIFQDITVRKENEKELVRAKEKAEESDRLKTAFLNNISHEVRTPLNGILGFAEIMSEPDLSDEDKKDSISMLQESSDRLLNTITNYMDISLITVGNLTIYKKDFFPAQILRKVFENYKPLCSDKKLKLLLVIREQDSDISINSDPEIVEKITCHLLNNAIKFTENGSISFGYKIQKGELEFFVQDTGIGIGKESFKIVFDNFAKEDRGALKFTEGSGLGLSIAKGMIQILGGSIRVESESGVGSVFFFTIPLTRNNETVPSGTSGGKNRKSISKAPILVAEDDEINFFYLKTLLNLNTSAEIIHASNGKEALDIFVRNPDIGLILMDIKMPVMDGIEATKQIKALKKNVVVIAITAYAMAGDEAKILNAGFDSYISKPINKENLLGKIAEYIVI